MNEIPPGTRYGPFEILSKIGVGGMGAVYRAMDTRLGREVAIKVSAEKFSERFERESRAVAALNHPNICTLYDVGADYLVMELVEGATLAELLKDGPIPLERAIEIIRQIAAALEAAHEKGIVHRDLKPANIKVKPDGTVKVLDFGLAKIVEPPAGSLSPENMPTVMLGETQAGMIIGTAGYMAPEQARGIASDKRADIWAFGVVFYEMLTGHSSFQAETVPDMLVAVLTREPDWNPVPQRAQLLLRRCLEKDPKRRLRDIGDALPLLDMVPQAETQPVAGGRSETRRGWFWPATAAVLSAAALLLAFVHFREQPPAVDPVRFTIGVPKGLSLVSPGAFALSPDGRKLVFGAIGPDGSRRLWVRTFDSLEAHPLEEARIFNPSALFWSPDSRYIAYQDTEDKLRKIAVSGGLPEVICDLTAAAIGGSWNRNGTIIFGSLSGGIRKVDAAGGMPVEITKPDAKSVELHLQPRFLPDQERFLYVSFSNPAPERRGLLVGSINVKPEDQSSTVVTSSFLAPVYVPPFGTGSGQLLYLRETTLLAQTLDLNQMQLTGDPVTVADPVGFSAEMLLPFASVSENGVLVHRAGGSRDLQFTWFNREGKVLEQVAEPARYSVVALSPDGKRVATGLSARQNSDIWVVDLAGGGSSRFTFSPGADQQPIWSKDGQKIAFVSFRDGSWGLYQKSASGAGNDELLAKSERATNVTDWSRDGRFVLYHTPDAPRDLFILPLDGDRKPVPFLQTKFDEFGARFSPDGRWILYISNESGSNEIYVQPFNPSSGGQGAPAAGKWMVSRGTVGMPRWRADGKELFYMAPDGSIMSVDVNATPVFSAGPPKALFQVPPVFLRTSVNPGAFADIAPDGQRFLFAMPAITGEEFNVALNWRVSAKE